MQQAIKAAFVGAMLAIVTWCALVVLEAVVTDIKCRQLGGIVYQGECKDLKEVHREMTRFKTYGGWKQ